MNTNTKRLLAEIEHERKVLKKRIEVIKSLPIEEFTDAFPSGTFNHFMGSTYNFTLPMNFELIAQFKAYIAEKHPEWMIYNEWQSVFGETAGGHFISIGDVKDFRLDIDFRTNREGATCVIKQIGFEQKPVYEITCSEGAKEDTFGVQS